MDTESLLSIKKLPECNLFNEVYLNEIKIILRNQI